MVFLCTSRYHEAAGMKWRMPACCAYLPARLRHSAAADELTDLPPRNKVGLCANEVRPCFSEKPPCFANVPTGFDHIAGHAPSVHPVRHEARRGRRMACTCRFAHGGGLKTGTRHYPLLLHKGIIRRNTLHGTAAGIRHDAAGLYFSRKSKKCLPASGNIF